MVTEKKLSIYIHIPFCTVKCSYCAFNIYTHLEHLIDRFVQSLVSEIAYVGNLKASDPVHTIYFGGGTPTLLKVDHYKSILKSIFDNFEVEKDVEISTEANPNDLLQLDYLEGLFSLGIERLSIGVQSANQSELEMFGRLHDDKMIGECIQTARQAGFKNINLDLIYAIPNQTMTMWDYSLQSVVSLNVEHLSLYGLGLEPDTALEAWVRTGKLPEPDDDLAADMYDYASIKLQEAGFEQYEISNWAKPGFESIHNLQYWRNQPYLGFGPGAHGYANNIRYEVVRSPHRYINLLQSESSIQNYPLSPAVDQFHAIEREDEISETIMMGLRMLKEGIHLTEFEQRFGVRLESIREKPIEEYQRFGAIEITDDRLLLTPKGRLVSNRILRDLT